MLRHWTLLRTVCVMTAGCFVAIGFALAGLLEHQVRDRLVDESQRRAVQVALEVSRGQVGQGPLGPLLDPAAVRELDSLLTRVQVGRWVHDVKLWNFERRVLYTQDLEVLGDRRPTELELGGQVVDGAWPLLEVLEEPAASRVGEGAVHVGGHGHDDASEIPDMSRISDASTCPSHLASER